MKNFWDCKKVADKTEREVGEWLADTFGHELLGFNHDARFDLTLLATDGKRYRVEVKEDFTCERTGNVGIEHSDKRGPSGFSLTQADYYAIVAHTPKGRRLLLIEKRELAGLIRRAQYVANVKSGDPRLKARSYLFPLDTLARHATLDETLTQED